jgi:hypothetical protein
MPLVRIDLREGTSPDYRNALGDGVQRAMIEAFVLPPDDRFQVITEHPPEGIIYDRTYLGIQRSDKIVLVQITMSNQSRGSRLGKLVLWQWQSPVHGHLIFLSVVRWSVTSILR